MYPDFACSVTFYDGLRRIDEDLCQRWRERGCPHCGGPLDSSPWLRKPRGCDLPEEICWRQGLCCRTCRRRVLPPSTLFLGRKVFLGAVALVSTLVRRRRVAGWTAKRLREHFDVSVATLRRWLTFFGVELPKSAGWRRLRGRVPPWVRDDGLPGQLLAVYDQATGPTEAALVAVLSLLASG